MLRRLMRPWARTVPLLAWGVTLVAPANAERDEPPPKLQEARAEFVTLGTGGGPLTRLNRSQPANAVVVGADIYLSMSAMEFSGR